MDMETGVTVPLPLLEDIFRLLDYLGGLGVSVGRRFDYTALWELELKIKRLQDHVVETYLLTVVGITEEERDDLEEWVAGGNSVYENPYLFCDESGRPMDFINACRAGLGMCQNLSGYVGDASDDGAGGNWDDGELPF